MASSSVSISCSPGTIDYIGTVTLLANGSSVATTSYGSGSTPSSITESLALLASSSLVYVSAVDNTLYIESTASDAGNAYSYSVVISDTAGFSPASFSASPSGGNLQGVSGGGSSSGPIYTYAASYDGVGNVTGYTDSVMGTWSFGYDTLNRLLSGQNTGTTSTSRQYAGQNLCWAYDSFGNRTAQSQQSAACSTSTMAQFASTWCASPKYSRPSFSWISGLAQVAETISLLTVRTLRFLGRIEFGEAQVVKD